MTSKTSHKSVTDMLSILYINDLNLFDNSKLFRTSCLTTLSLSNKHHKIVKTSSFDKSKIAKPREEAHDFPLEM